MSRVICRGYLKLMEIKRHRILRTIAATQWRQALALVWRVASTALSQLEGPPRPRECFHTHTLRGRVNS